MASWKQLLYTDGDGSGLSGLSSSHTHSYLPLIGGTLTGNLILSSRLTLDYGGDHYLEAGTGTWTFKNSGGTSALQLNFSDLSAIFAGNIKRSDSSNNVEFDISADSNLNTITSKKYQAGYGRALSIRTKESAGESLRIDTSGNVGIGTDAPSEKLHLVDGDMMVDSGRGIRGPAGTEMIRFNTSTGTLINAGGAVALTLDTSQNATFAGRAIINGGGAGTYNNNLEINNDSTVPSRIFVNNTGSTGYTGADIVLQTHHAHRGAGIYTYNTGDDRGFYMGTPYGTSNQWHLCYEATSAFDVATAETAHSIFYINSSGSATFAGDVNAVKGTFSDNVSIPATKKLYLDGGSNTYISEFNGDKVRVVCGNATAMSWFDANTYIPATAKLFFDGNTDITGTGFDTYMYQSQGNRLHIYVGGNNTLQLDDANATFAGDITMSGVISSTTGSFTYASGTRLVIGSTNPISRGSLGNANATFGVVGGEPGIEIYRNTSPERTLGIRIGAFTETDVRPQLYYGGQALRIGYVPAASNAALTDVLTLGIDGKVGIGTTSPDKTLSVAGNAIIGQDVTSGFSYIYLGEEADADKCLVFGYDHDNNWGGFCIGGESLGTGGLNIANGGNVGIGTTSPTYALDVAGNVGVDQYITHNGDTNTYIDFQNNYVGMVANGKVLVNNDGNVGIGITSPQTQLNLKHASAPNIRLTRITAATSGGMGAIQFGNSTDQILAQIRSEQDGATDAGKIIFSTEATGAGETDALTLGSDNSATFAGDITMSSAGNTELIIATTDTNDSNTKISFRDSGGEAGRLDYSHYLNALKVFVNSAERMRIDSSGNLGIGETSPDTLLHLKSGAPCIRLEDSDGTDLYGEMCHNGGTLSLLARNGTSGASHGVIQFLSGHTSTPRMTIDLAGKVGIGTSSPDEKLHVQISDASLLSGFGETGVVFEKNDALIQAFLTPTDKWAAITFQDSSMGGGAIMYDHGTALGMGAGSMGFRTESASVFDMVITSGGKVGIGTASPAHELVVHNANGGTNSAIQISNDDSSTGAGNGVELDLAAGGVNFSLWNNENGYVRFGTNNTTALTLDNSQDATFAGDLILSSNNYLSLNNQNNNNRAYIGNQGTNASQISFMVGGYGNAYAELLLESGSATFAGDVSIPATKKLYLDGGSNTYIYESASDTISFAAGMGGTALTLTTLQSTFSGSVRCGVNFQSSDGTSGANVVKSWEDPARDTHTVTIKDGLITSWVIAP